MKRNKLVKIVAPLFLIVILFTTSIYFNHSYLYFPFTVPAPITEKQGFTYKLFEKPVSVEVMTDEYNGDELLRSFYYPTNKNKYETLARKITDYYAKILKDGNKIPLESTLIAGKRYVVNLRCAGVVMLKMDFTDNSEKIKMGNDLYTITPDLRDEFINYLRNTYPIKETGK